MKRFKELYEAPKDPNPRHGISMTVNQVDIEPDDEEATTYKPRSRKEQEFKDQHTIQKVAHPVAPDSQFTGDKEGDPEHHKGGKKQANGETSLIKQGSSDVKAGGTPFKSFQQFGRGGEKSPVMQGSSKIKEEVELDEGVVDTLKKIVSSKQPMDVKFKNGKTMKVDNKTASALISVHNALKPENAKKLRDNLEQGPSQFMNMVDFAVSNA